MSEGWPGDDGELPSLLDELSLWSSHFGRLLLENLPLAQGRKVLDVGCGAGFPLLELAQRLGRSSTVVGVDPWAPAVSRARWKALQYGLVNTRIVRGDGAGLPFAAGVFDLVVSNLGLNNFEQPEQVLRECGRVTRPGGRLALTTNPAGHLKELYDIFAAVLRELDLEERLPALARHVAHRLGPTTIEAMLVRAGFDPVRIRQDSFALRAIDGTAFLEHFLVRVGFRDGWRSVLDPDRPEQEQAVFARLEAALNRKAAAEGSLALTVPMVYLEAQRRAS